MILLVQVVYPRQHPHYSDLWPDMVARLAQPSVSLHQVMLAELWLREREHLEGQLACCRKDMVRGLAKLVKVVQWAVGQRREEQERREEREGHWLVNNNFNKKVSSTRVFRCIASSSSKGSSCCPPPPPEVGGREVGIFFQSLLR